MGSIIHGDANPLHGLFFGLAQKDSQLNINCGLRPAVETVVGIGVSPSGMSAAGLCFNLHLRKRRDAMIEKLYYRIWWGIVEGWLRKFNYKLVPGVSE